ncbi:MAG: ATPase [Natronomonas sp.]
MRLLVAGSAAVDAGKTTFSTGLIERTGLPGYKPRAGNDYWYDHDDVREAAAAGRLYGKDASRLAAVAPGDTTPEEINPVHRLWLPTPGGGTGILGRSDRAFAVDRVRYDGADRFVVNGTVDVPEWLDDRLPIEDAQVVDDVETFNEVMSRLHVPAISEFGASMTDAAVVESYADIALPISEYTPDAVAVVEPRRCRVFDGPRYARACDVASGSPHEGRLEERVGDVLELLDPVERVRLPALTTDQRRQPEAVAEAYAPAYEALLEAV